MDQWGNPNLHRAALALDDRLWHEVRKMNQLSQSGVLFAALLSIYLGVFSPRCNATTVAAWPWDYQCQRAGFIGIVQCEVAGLITAKYRVVESWKGPSIGSLLTINQTLDSWGPGTPFMLCGSRYLICAFPSEDTSSTRWCNFGTPGCGQPYWWRNPKAELFTSLATPPLLLRGKDDRIDLGRFGFGRGSLRAYRDSVRARISLPPEVNEATELRRWGRSTLTYQADRETSVGFRMAANGLRTRLDSLNADGIVASLIRLAIDYPRQGRLVAEDILTTMGGSRALAGLRSETGMKAFPGDTLKWNHPLRQIAQHAGASLPQPLPPVLPAPSGPPSDSELVAYRIALKGPLSQGFFRAFEYLTVNDPSAVAEMFEHTPFPRSTSWIAPNAYALGSYFAYHCGRDRKSIHRRLLDALDPSVRVAGAVYLAMEDSVEGPQALRRLSSLEGFPGAWAATALASRGDKDAAERALDAFDLPVSYEEGHYTTGLMARVLVLLSNSASVSRLPQPPYDFALFSPGAPHHRNAVKAIRKWWKRVRRDIRIWDPWLVRFDQQGVD